MIKEFGIKKLKIKAGSLQFVLFVGAVIAVLLLTFVLLVHGHFLFAKKTDKYVDIIKKTDRAIQLSLYGEKSESNQQYATLEDDGISTIVKEKNWGIYKIITASSTFQRSSFEKTVLTGGRLPDPKVALFLKDNNRPIVIAGQSQIIGDALLPKQGIRVGNIGGNSFHGSLAVQGKQGLSTSKWPQMESANRNALDKLLSTEISNTQNDIVGLNQQEITNSFLDPTLFVDKDIADLSGKKLSGNIVIRSSHEIYVDASTQLTDVILVAPKIRIGNGVRGIFQAVASKEIQVGKNCHLKYPSAVVVLQKKNQLPNSNTYGTQPQINLLENSIVEGTLGYFTRDPEQVYYPQIRIGKHATVIGQVHCEKNIELKGSVLGNVTTNGFVALENGNVYQNHLYNGTMDVTGLPIQYVGMSFGKNSKKGVVKCLY